MSIYCTLWTIQVEDSRGSWREIWAQGVPGHIDYVGDKWDWLPPPVQDEDKLRAVVVITGETQKGTERCGQEYVDPLLILSGDEYVSIGFDDMLHRIDSALRARGL